LMRMRGATGTRTTRRTHRRSILSPAATSAKRRCVCSLEG